MYVSKAKELVTQISAWHTFVLIQVSGDASSWEVIKVYFKTFHCQPSDKMHNVGFHRIFNFLLKANIIIIVSHLSKQEVY